MLNTLKAGNSKSSKGNEYYVTHTSLSTQIFLCWDQSSRWHSLEQYSILQIMQHLSPVKPQNCKKVQNFMHEIITSKPIKKIIRHDRVVWHIYPSWVPKENVSYDWENQYSMYDSGPIKYNSKIFLKFSLVSSKMSSRISLNQAAIIKNKPHISNILK